MSYGLFYSVQTSEASYNELTIGRDGVVTASIQFTAPGWPVRALGHYYMDAVPGDVDLIRIRELIHETGLALGESFLCQARFGGRYKMFCIEWEGNETCHSADIMAPLPQPLVSLESLLVPLFARVGLKAPQRTLSINLSFKPVAVAPGSNLRIVLEIINRGPFPTVFRNFAGFLDKGTDRLIINFWIPPEREGEAPVFVWTMNLSGREWLVAERQALRSKDAYLRIDMHGSLRTWTDVRMPKAMEGRLLAELVFISHMESEEEEENSDLVVGEYHTDPVELAILRPARS